MTENKTLINKRNEFSKSRNFRKYVSIIIYIFTVHLVVNYAYQNG